MKSDLDFILPSGCHRFSEDERMEWFVEGNGRIRMEKVQFFNKATIDLQMGNRAKKKEFKGAKKFKLCVGKLDFNGEKKIRDHIHITGRKKREEGHQTWSLKV